jgi:hypothetical protein
MALKRTKVSKTIDCSHCGTIGQVQQRVMSTLELRDQISSASPSILLQKSVRAPTDETQSVSAGIFLPQITLSKNLLLAECGFGNQDFSRRLSA